MKIYQENKEKIEDYLFIAYTALQNQLDRRN